MAKIKVLILEDHNSYVQGISSYFNNSRDVEYIGYAETPEKCLDILKKKEVDVVLVDIKIGNDENLGIRAVKTIKALYQQMNSEIEKREDRKIPPKMIFLTGHNEPRYIDIAKQLRCSLLGKELDIPKIIEYIIKVVTKNKFIIDIIIDEGKKNKPQNDSLKQEIEAREKLQEGLTKAEGKVVICSYEYAGKDKETIAEKLKIKKNTLNTHLKNIYFKLDIRSRNDNNNKSGNETELIKLVGQSKLHEHFDEIMKQPEDWFGKERKR